MVSGSTLNNSGSSVDRQIAALIEVDDAWGRSVLQSIARFASQNGWQLLIAPRDAERRLRVPPGWEGDGVIALLRDDSLLDHLRDLNAPTVNISGMYHDVAWMGHVATDNEARARLAFDHFADQQLTHFYAYCPALRREADCRGEVFVQHVRTRGHSCEMLTAELSANSHERIADRKQVATTLHASPKPVGVFASDPYAARHLVEICLSHGISVPGEVLVLSADEDELLCSLTLPPVTSIELASHRIGLEACQMLKSMIATGESPRHPILVEPLGVCGRRSTNHVAVGDPCMESVLEYIREHATESLQVKDLTRIAAMSRRSLEIRFRDVYGRSPAEEIRRVRLEKARQLLLNSSKSVSSVAHACGFSSGPYLTTAFRRVYGKTPSELRAGRTAILKNASGAR